MGDGSYFDSAPQQSDFGVNSEGSTINDVSEASKTTLGSWPLYKQFLAGMDYAENTLPAIGRLFDGEATFEDYFNIADSSLTLAVNLIELVELGAAIAEGFAGDPWALIGSAVGSLVMMIQTFILETLQPVQDLFGMITGNPDRIRISKAMWETLAAGISPIGQELVKLSETLGEAWQDDAGAAAQHRLLEGNDVIQVSAALAGGVAESLEFCATTFEKVQAYVISRCGDIASALVSYVPMALEGPKGWALIVLDFVPMIARIIIETIQIAMHLARAMTALIMLMNGAEEAAEKMLPYVDGMGAPA